MLSIIMSSPLLIAIVGLAGTCISAFAKKPMTDEYKRRNTSKSEQQTKVDRILEINETLDRHINNNEIPFRQQMNDKLDYIGDTVTAITESTKSINLSVSSLALRVEKVEDELDDVRTGLDIANNDIRKLKRNDESSIDGGSKNDTMNPGEGRVS